VGSKALKLWQAVVIAAIFEFGGAVLLGSAVTDTVRKGIANVEIFEEQPELLMLGMLCANLGAGIWLLVATRLSLAVSTTHSIVGAIIGVFLVAGGPSGIDWAKVGLIIASWFASPLLSGLVSASFFFFIRYFLLRSQNSLERTLIFYPILVGFTLAINVFFIIFKGAPGLGGGDTPIWVGILISLGCGLFVGLILHFLVVPFIRKRLHAWEERQKEKNTPNQIELGASNPEVPKDEPAKEEKTEEKPEEKAEGKEKEDSPSDLEPKIEEHQGEGQEQKPEASGVISKTSSRADMLQQDGTSPSPSKSTTFSVKSALQAHRDRLTGKKMMEDSLEDSRVRDIHKHAEAFDPKTERMYTYLQVFTAIFDSFAHGANDVANSIAPFAALYTIYLTGGIPTKSPVPVWILAMGGAGIVVGLVGYGYKIIQAIGMSLTKITPSRGFTIELGTAFTVVVFSIVGVPISTTHCQVGSTAAIGFFDGFEGVNMRLLLLTFGGWVVTMFFSGLVAALFFSFAVYSPFVVF